MLTYRLIETKRFTARERILARQLNAIDARRLCNLLMSLRPQGDDTEYHVCQETGA